MTRTNLYRLLILGATAAACGGDGADPAGSPAIPAEGGLLAPAEMQGTVIDEETAKALFRGVREGARQQYDPVAYAVLKPDVTQSWPWPEHPDGKIVSRTNNLGFRRDTPTAEAKTGPRILVAGDSQTDGMVNNAESFCTLLEARLNGVRDGGALIEVLNAGVGNTGPHNYVGTLKRNLHLRPDAFVAVLYTGNDFLNALALSDFFSKRPESRPSGADGEAYQRLMVEAYGTHGPIVVDRFNQALKFTRFPADAEIGLQASIECFAEMAVLCAQERIPFLAVVLPTKPDVDRDAREDFAEVLASCGISEAQYGINAELGRRFSAALRERGIRVLDTTDALRAANSTPHYWRKDWHLNPAGHALVAELLEAEAGVLLTPPR
jgi:hypothetical protein